MRQVSTEPTIYQITHETDVEKVHLRFDDTPRWRSRSFLFTVMVLKSMKIFLLSMQTTLSMALVSHERESATLE